MASVTENPEEITVKQDPAANVIDLGSAFNPIERNALILLNQAITIPNFKTLWTKYSLKICGDGGANRLYDYIPDEQERLEYLPHFIVGDFDSLRDDVRDWYEKHGVSILPQTTQWATDLNKCLDLAEIYYDYKDSAKELIPNAIDPYDGIIELHKHISSTNKVQVVLVGAIDGRFDHTIHSISLLFKLAESNPNLNLFYLSPTDIIFLIPKGKNFLNYKQVNHIFHGANTGLLPLGGEITLSTEGLKWDVTNWVSSVKGSVSSSNRLVGNYGVSLETNDDFVINIELDYQKL